MKEKDGKFRRIFFSYFPVFSFLVFFQLSSLGRPDSMTYAFFCSLVALDRLSLSPVETTRGNDISSKE